MAGEQVIEQLVVKLGGDGSEYAQMLREAEQQTRESTRAIEQLSSNIEGFAGAAAAALAAFGIGGLLNQALGNFQEAESIAIKLTSALEANGRQVEETMRSYGAFAEEMERLTTFEDEEILNLLRLAEGYGVTGQAARKAVQDATALAAATDVSAEGALRLTTALAKGETETAQRFARLIPQLRGIKSETEFLAKAQKLVQTGTSTLAREAATSAGQLKMLWRDFGNALEDVGETVASLITPFVAKARDLVQMFRDLSPETKRWLTIVASAATALVGLGGAMTALGTIWPVISQGFMTALGPLQAIFGMFGGLTKGSTTLLALWQGFTTTIGMVLKVVMFLVNPIKTILGLWTLISGAVTGIVSLISLIISPVGLLVAGLVAATAAVTVLVQRAGGLEAVWNMAVKAVQDFWEWLLPVRQAAMSLFNAVVEVGTQAFIDLGNWVVDTFNSLLQWLGIANVDWVGGFTKMREWAVDALLTVEFGIRNLGKVWEVAWTAIQYGAVVAFNEIAYYAMEVIPTHFSNMSKMIQTAFKVAFTFGMTLGQELVKNIQKNFQIIVQFIREVPMLLARGFSVEDIGKRAGAAFSQAMGNTKAAFQKAGDDARGALVEGLGDLKQVADRPIGALEKELRERLEKQARELGLSLEEFIRQRRASFALTPEEEKALEEPPKAAQQNYKKAAEEIKRFDAALAGSAEASQRISEYLDNIKRPAATLANLQGGFRDARKGPEDYTGPQTAEAQGYARLQRLGAGAVGAAGAFPGAMQDANTIGAALAQAGQILRGLGGGGYGGEAPSFGGQIGGAGLGGSLAQGDLFGGGAPGFGGQVGGAGLGGSVAQGDVLGGGRGGDVVEVTMDPSRDRMPEMVEVLKGIRELLMEQARKQGIDGGGLTVEAADLL